jgi:hypothetical protein
MIKSVILLAIMLVTLENVQAQNESLDSIQTLKEFVAFSKKGKWKEARNKKGVSLNYRDLVFSSSIKTRQLSAKFKLDSCNLDSIIAHIKLPKYVKLWNEGVRDINILKKGDDNWVSHTTYNIPFPFKQQDLVTHSIISQQENKVILYSKSLPDYISPKKGVTREGYNLSEWRLTKSVNGTIEVEFCVISLTNSSIPRFLKDPIIQRKLLTSFINLKENLL